jgi:SPP1 family predicted phage head-tail adaptor
MPKPETIGKLDRRITFQSKIVGDNESNEDEEEGWENISINPTVWASKDERRGNEVYRADKLTDYLNVGFVCRYRSDITPKHRIVCDGIPYNIIAITEISRKRYMSIDCEAGGEFIELEEVGPGFTEGFSVGFRL